MASLEELLQIDGVVAAFATDGSTVDYKTSMEIAPGLMAGAAAFCETVTTTFDKLSESYSQLSGMNWNPQRGWAYTGGDWTIVVGEGGRKGVFVETAKADFGMLFSRVVLDS